MSSTPTLVIVESPAKAKTIERYLGSGYRVLSSIGHIREIPPKDENAIDIANGFKTRYEVIPDKKKTVLELKRAVKQADAVWLATDEDREGEAIAWHLCEVLGLDLASTDRIVFHEITKSALEEAVRTPRRVDMNLVRAQQARQILDRIVGYELSPVVWRKVPGGKSAGRVQSPALRLVVEREREISAFESEAVFKVAALLSKDANLVAEVIAKHGGSSDAANVSAIDAAASTTADAKTDAATDSNPSIPDATADTELVKAELAMTLPDEKAAQAFLEKLIGATWQVTDIESKPATRNPPPPFTTSTLQQEANSRFGMSPRSTMSAAQALYQDGKITYMRTDSTNLSDQALGAIGKWISANLGTEYAHKRQYKTKSVAAQEAHEAIRPTDISVAEAGKNDFEKRVYQLIRSRTLASQMAAARLERTTVTIVASAAQDANERFAAKGEAVLFDGFLRVYGKSSEKYLPLLATGDELFPCDVTARQSFNKPPARYTEGTLVKKLEELGIGRPSTYATILDNIKSRGYVTVGEGEGKDRAVVQLKLIGSDLTRSILNEKTGADKGKLVPNAIGEVLSDFLLEYFKDIVDYGFTAQTETELDEIGSGKRDEISMLNEFYGPFHALIEASADIDRRSVSKMREIGIDAKSGKPVSARIGRFGPMLQLGTAEDDEKPTFAKLPDGMTIDTVTLEAAMEMFRLPRLLGQTNTGREVRANTGRFGPYIQVGKGRKGTADAAVFVSIPKTAVDDKGNALDPFNITLAQALVLYDEKLAKDAAKVIADLGCGIQVLNGRWGPYITDGKTNVTVSKINKDLDPATITLEQAKEALANPPTKRAKGKAAKAGGSGGGASGSGGAKSSAKTKK
ncbi:MAG: type I DNA topoisomerase [Coriobacteriales bacterium]|nr:type I DNA topoisomerase [Coriobacteriales bacterium]